MGLVRRSFANLDEKSFIKLYTALVGPHLEHAQSVWAPHLKRLTDLIQNVQIRATKLADHFGNLEFSECLKRLNLPTLSSNMLRENTTDW